jgi:hypothetical protein
MKSKFNPVWGLLGSLIGILALLGLIYLITLVIRIAWKG